MTCPDCSRHAQRLQELEARLGISRRLGAIGAVCDHFEVTPSQARLLLRLYAAGACGPVTCEALADVMNGGNRASMKTTINYLRNTLGQDSVVSVGWGRGHSGYKLSDQMMSRMLAALERPEFQEAAGTPDREPVEILGMKVVVDPFVPVDEVWLVPAVEPIEGETHAERRVRQAMAAVRLVHLRP